MAEELGIDTSVVAAVPEEPLSQPADRQARWHRPPALPHLLLPINLDTANSDAERDVT